MSYTRLSAAEFNKKLKGLVIKRVVFNPFPDKRGGVSTDPVIVFEDYSGLRFVVEEHDAGGDYGVALIFREDETGISYAYGNEKEEAE